MGNNDFFLKPINNASVVQQVIDRLTDAMLKKQLRPGDKIPTEVELAETFGVGRNSIREAVKILVYSGVLEIRRAEGTFVRSGISENMINPLLYSIILNTDESWTSLNELRELMEVGVIKLAMKKCNEEDMVRLKEKFDAFETALMDPHYDIDQVFEADNDFHKAVSSMGHNLLVDKINTIVRELTHSIRFQTVSSMISNGEKEALLQVHKNIYDLLLARDMEDLDEIIRNSYFFDRGFWKEQKKQPTEPETDNESKPE